MSNIIEISNLEGTLLDSYVEDVFIKQKNILQIIIMKLIVGLNLADSYDYKFNGKFDIMSLISVLTHIVANFDMTEEDKKNDKEKHIDNVLGQINNDIKDIINTTDLDIVLTINSILKFHCSADEISITASFGYLGTSQWSALIEPYKYKYLYNIQIRCKKD